MFVRFSHDRQPRHLAFVYRKKASDGSSPSKAKGEEESKTSGSSSPFSFLLTPSFLALTSQLMPSLSQPIGLILQQCLNIRSSEGFIHVVTLQRGDANAQLACHLGAWMWAFPAQGLQPFGRGSSVVPRTVRGLARNPETPGEWQAGRCLVSWLRSRASWAGRICNSGSRQSCPSF